MYAIVCNTIARRFFMIMCACGAEADLGPARRRLDNVRIGMLPPSTRSAELPIFPSIIIECYPGAVHNTVSLPEIELSNSMRHLVEGKA